MADDGRAFALREEDRAELVSALKKMLRITDRWDAQLSTMASIAAQIRTQSLHRLERNAKRSVTSSPSVISSTSPPTILPVTPIDSYRHPYQPEISSTVCSVPPVPHIIVPASPSSSTSSPYSLSTFANSSAISNLPSVAVPTTEVLRASGTEPLPTLIRIEQPDPHVPPDFQFEEQTITTSRQKLPPPLLLKSRPQAPYHSSTDRLPSLSAASSSLSTSTAPSDFQLARPQTDTNRPNYFTPLKKLNPIDLDSEGDSGQSLIPLTEAGFNEERVDKGCKHVENSGKYFAFFYSSRLVKPTLLHFQLRNLVCATSKHDAYLMSNYSVQHWSALSQNLSEVIKFAGHVAPTEKHQGSLLTGFSQAHISTLAVKPKFLVAGGFQGELACKRLDKFGLSFCNRTTYDENANINAVEIFDDLRGRIHFMASNNDCGVREYEMGKFQLLKGEDGAIVPVGCISAFKELEHLLEKYSKVAMGGVEALNHLHNGSPQPVTHRDVKSSTILLSDAIEPQLTDCRLASGATSDALFLFQQLAGTQLIQKLEHSAVNLAESRQHGSASAVAPSLLETEKASTVKGMQILEKVGKEIMELLILETGLTVNIRPGTGLTVAVKTLDHDGLQVHKEWLAEVTYLGELVHPNLVTLIGYCIEDDQRLLVYEFMPRGSLENHLFRRSLPLPWSTRMKIALGAAMGLAFLHEEAERPVIYRDFKTSNILLDVVYDAKLSDFVLAKDGPEGDKTHVSTRVMGTYGYAAPEYVMTGHLTSRSNVYIFSVVLVESRDNEWSFDKCKRQWDPGKYYVALDPDALEFYPCV